MTTHVRPQREAQAIPKPEIGKKYRIVGYHSGDFLGTCLATMFTQARYRVEDPLRSTLTSGAELDIRYGLVKFEQLYADEWPETARETALNSFPTTEAEATAMGYSFAYRTTCLRCGEPIRFWRTPGRRFIPINRTGFIPHWNTCALHLRFRRSR